MDYRRIYDDFIESRRGTIREDGVIYHNHHITPLHIDPTSKETVSLTIREHIFAHKLLHKITGTRGNKLAYILLSKAVSRIDILSEIGRYGGLIGGKRTKENESGIFSDDWDRAEETRRRWREGTLNKSQFQHLRENGHYIRAGLAAVEAQAGIHSPDYDHSEASRNHWANLDEDARKNRVETNRINAAKGGQRSKELGTNFSTWDPEKRFLTCSKGGKTAGKRPMWTNGRENKKQFECPGEGWWRGLTRRKNFISVEESNLVNFMEN